MSIDWQPDRRGAWAEVDLSAIRSNVSLLASIVKPSILCAVVKANAYGHGAQEVAVAALDGGAQWLAVAFGEEALEVREAVTDAPILLLQEPSVGTDSHDIRDLLELGIVPTVYSAEGIERIGKVAQSMGRKVDVHLKVDTGMHRVGADIKKLDSVMELLSRFPFLRVTGLWSHLAVADGDCSEDIEFTDRQLEALKSVSGEVGYSEESPVMLHLANSAGAIAHPSTRLDMVRCGISIYGEIPSEMVAAKLAEQVRSAEQTRSAEQVGSHSAGYQLPLPPNKLIPALSLKARVSHVRELEKGERLSYGRHYKLDRRSIVATVPLGYADGLARGLFKPELNFNEDTNEDVNGGTNGYVLLRGEKRPIAGTVTMDQVLIDCGADASVSVGDEVVVIGEQADVQVTASDLARKLGTISYEVFCGISSRIPRVYLNR
ncbi:MAG: alanine racemase [Actinobacteria bacterium]|nr:alanine racemase [Actinomycetota bacterium]